MSWMGLPPRHRAVNGDADAIVGRTKDGQVVRRKGGKMVKTRRMVAEQAWAPSKDKMTVQVFWWGYRL
jgi:hypothetical protein